MFQKSFDKDAEVNACSALFLHLLQSLTGIFSTYELLSLSLVSQEYRGWKGLRALSFSISELIESSLRSSANTAYWSSV